MPSIDITSEFRQRVEDLTQSPSPSARSAKSRARDHNRTRERGKAAEDGFLTEAYSILKHITTLSDLLRGIRRPYLNFDSQAPVHLSTSRAIDLTENSTSWSDVKYLSNEERDQIDLQSRVILTRCADRVKELEESEKLRAETSSSKTSALLRFLPARLTHTESASAADFIAAHRSNITWYLTRRMADVSQFQKEMQEERVKRQLERTRTLASSYTPSDFFPAEYDTPSSSTTIPQGRSVPPPVESYSDLESDDDMELSPSQILQFEEENAAILRSQEDMLQSVQLAEARLLDISALQTQLIAQLAKQTEVVDQLYDEAITSQAEVDKGNVQLKQARERGRESRQWLLLFILGATMALLFLHWYD
ncbi:hypothetical protein BOTBODRAFT_151676 [Botryobasidium botryosum FD-172 SS1]|uniref:SNARE-complex protein Syntaxin-18 N-terminal domain-containing protein n=1 Tax=Botryobasidium botryosum (strain FD-172 SS1) TaxID=930990 RepID=A0A067MYE7_BOTB1|nr:hypothetical protein BOTBODRAFT_151676 [Botryobasidium botryosum FD-172 SS1]